ncbi:MAG: 3-dehydroquinate synthase [Bacteroidota bacterium]
MQRVTLADYSIFIGSDIWAAWQAFLAERSYSRLIVLVDENTRKYCMPLFAAHTPTLDRLSIQIVSGEAQKNIDTCQAIWSSMMAADIDRQALMVNLGGGVIGDMGGFCASTYKRGIDFVQFPTTLLSQVDASIGGKLGIDFRSVKNSVGVFNNPQNVFIQLDFLQTLSARERRSGFAEMLKHSLIADRTQWDRLKDERNLSAIDWLEHLPMNLMIKQRIVAQDPFERGLRKALNFGHTIGHAVESHFLKTETPLLHGEAIAIGMICESFLSHRVLHLSEQALNDIVEATLDIYGHVDIPKEIDDYLLQMMRKDKKNENKQINLSLLPAIGEVKVNCTADDQLILDSIDYYRSLQ